MAFFLRRPQYMVQPKGMPEPTVTNGMAMVQVDEHVMRFIYSNEYGWEHVSVSFADGSLPIWDEMCLIKDLFWDAEDCVIQFHPPRSQYVNRREVLHLWRKIGTNWETPPMFLVG